jgi:hypothetical protein
MTTRRTISDIRMGYDMYERHQAVRTLLDTPAGAAVLDVGGIAGGLQSFLPGAKVTALNIDDTGDVHYDGKTIPYPDGAFDTVVSLDTLEHVPPSGRARFVTECRRVSRHTMLIAAPYGSGGHGAYEAKLDKLYRVVYGDYHRWLHEHVVNGLPQKDDLAAYRRTLAAAACTVTTYYCGDYTWQCANLERSLTLQRRLQGLGPLRKAANVYDLLTLAAPWPAPVFALDPTPTTNRFYLLAHH